MLAKTSPQKQGIRYSWSWKDTYAKLVTGVSFRHSPIRVKGIYSDLLHRQWACRVCDIERACAGFFDPCGIDRIDGSSMNVKDFIEKYERRNVPVILTNIVNKWSAFKTWSWDYLESQAGDSVFRATSSTASRDAYFTVREYRKYSLESQEEAPLYMFDRDFINKVHADQDYTVPCHFNYLNEENDTDLFRLFGEARPDYRWLIIGPKRSGSMFHIDPNQTHAWNAVISGRKKWIFYPPENKPPGVQTSSDGADATMPVSTGEWLLSFWHFHKQAQRNPNVSLRPLECIVNPGELIFVPHNWWHMVINLDESIALTHNYVSSTNLTDCLKFLKTKVNQVSGLSERMYNANDLQIINSPETIFNNFLILLEQYDSEMVRKALDEIQDIERSDLLKHSTSLSLQRGQKRKHENVRTDNDACSQKNVQILDIQNDASTTEFKFSFM